jgi:glycerophosphoryl diester phosphodiesterase
MKMLILTFTLLMAAVPELQQPPLFVALQHQPTIICSHRSRLSPDQTENSVVEMQRTFAAAPVMLEMDLAESKDGTIYLLHDNVLDRTTDAVGPISNRSDAELANVHLKDSRSGKSLQSIPTFEQVLTWAQSSGAYLMLDIKRTPPRDVVTILKEHGLLDHVVLLTFDRETALKTFSADPTVLVSALARSRDEVEGALQSAHGHPLALYLPEDTSPALFADARRTGKPIITDTLEGVDAEPEPVRVEAYRAYLKTHPANILVTNHPQAAMKSLQTQPSQ